MLRELFNLTKIVVTGVVAAIVCAKLVEKTKI